MDHGRTNHRLARVGHLFISLREAAVAPQPGDGPLHPPARREQVEACGTPGPSAHVERTTNEPFSGSVCNTKYSMLIVRSPFIHSTTSDVRVARQGCPPLSGIITSW